MTTLIAIRHGRTSANAQGILAGRATGVYLDEVGIESSEALAKRLEVVPIAHVVVSPLERTRQTAEILFPQHQRVVQDDRFIECDYGDWQGQSLSELATLDLWSTVQNDPDQMIFPNGESMQDMFDRTLAGISEWNASIAQEFGSDAIWALVSHGDVIKAVIAGALGLPLKNFQSIMIDPASVNVIHYGEKTGVAKVNDTGEAWLQELKPVKTEPTLGGQTGQEA